MAEKLIIFKNKMTDIDINENAHSTIEQPKSAHPSFPQPEDTSVNVWRYLDLAKLIWLLENKKLYFSRLDLLSDPHEGSIPPKLAAQHSIQLMSWLMEERPELPKPSIENALRMHKEMLEVKRKLIKTHFINCWHLNNSESEAMWRLYCPNNDGVAIQTTYQNLTESVNKEEHLYMGCVTYLDYDSQGFPTDNIFNQIMHKRLSFSHEKEVRLVTSKIPESWGTPNESYVEGLSIDWPVENIVEAIYVNPYAPEYYQEVVRIIVNRFAPNLTEKVFWSKMRAIPAY